MPLADKAYDSGVNRSVVAANGGWANIRHRRNRRDPICCSRFLYRDRNLVERFFNRIKHRRRIATRYEKWAVDFLAFVKPRGDQDVVTRLIVHGLVTPPFLKSAHLVEHFAAKGMEYGS